MAGAFLDFEQCYRAVSSRDARFDGWFVTAVTSTQIYCRPSCSAITPKRSNVRFLPSAAAAQREGFRACLRCRPDTAPGSPEWNHRADVVGRAMRLITDGIVDRDGVPGLAARLGYTQRHLGRMLHAEVGAGPLALARAQRAQTARTLVETTDLALSEIAFAAGFGSVRQFNETIRQIYGRTPSALRAARRDGGRADELATITLRLAYREPLHAGALLEFLAARTIPGVDEVRDGTYRRALRLPHGAATAAITLMPRYAQARLWLSDVRDLVPAVARCRCLLDLDADPVAIDATLGADPVLGPMVAKEPGVRVPRAVDGFEMAVRAVVGQQISVVGARKVLARLAAAATTPTTPRQDPVDHEPRVMVGPVSRPQLHDRADLDVGRGDLDVALRGDLDVHRGDLDVDRGDLDVGRGDLDVALRGFPTADEVAAAPEAAFPMPAGRRRTLRALAEAVATDRLHLDPGADRAETEARLLEIPGIGPWTAQYVALRALGDPDVLLATDLGVRRGAATLGLPDDPASLAAHAAEHWAPWRSYATIRLWRMASARPR